MKKVVQYCLIILTLAVLLLPLMQDYVFKFKFKKLYGVIVKTEKPELVFDSLYSGSYQAQLEKYISENFGFREPTIRFYNQYLWDFYKTTPVQHVVKGKDGWMYFSQNVNEYYGTEIYNYFDTSEEAKKVLERRARTMNKLRIILKEFNVEVLAFEAPEKGLLYSEYLPDRKRDTTSVSAIDLYTKKFQDYGFPFIGMTHYYKQLKDTVSFPLFTKHGFHWNISCVYGADTLFRMMESLSGQKMPHLRLENFRTYDRSDKNYIIDFDIEQNMNLMRDIEYEGPAPVIADVVIDIDSNYVKPKMFFIGDSFMWRIHDFVDFTKVFGESRFWYYNNTAFFGKNIATMREATDFDPLREILKSDFIVLFAHGSQLHKLSYRFAEKALLEICVPDSIMNREIKRLRDSMEVSTGEARKMIEKNPELIPELRGEDVPTIRNTRRIAIIQTMNSIEKDEKWMQILKVKASIDSVLIDTVMMHEAINVIDGKPRFLDNTAMSDSILEQYEVNKIIEDMKRNPELLDMIREKAKKNHFTFEEQLLKDAKWVYKNQKKK